MPGASGKCLRHTRLSELQPNLPDIHAERQQAQPDSELIAEWKALDQEVFGVQHALPDSDVGTYQQVIKIYGQRNRDLRPVVDRYMAK